MIQTQTLVSNLGHYLMGLV